jgi:hypothetical protein
MEQWIGYKAEFSVEGSGNGDRTVEKKYRPGFSNSQTTSNGCADKVKSDYIISYKVYYSFSSCIFDFMFVLYSLL